MLKKILSIAILSSLSMLAVGSETGTISNDTKTVTQLEKSANEISVKFKTYFGGEIVNYVAEANLPNSYLVLLNDGTSMIYFKDTDYAVVGELYDLSKRKNLSGDLMADFNKSLLEKIKYQGFELPIKKGVKELGTVYVFTDPSCGYCRKLNSEKEQYAEHGIKLVYLPYSRSGENTKSYNELVDVWCSTDKIKAMDLAKSDRAGEIKNLPGYKLTEECKNAVAQGEQYGKILGVKGTPALFSSEGNSFPGYIPPDQLQSFLEDMK
jgi:thiol:disulfide interchange protein DsbC